MVGIKNRSDGLSEDHKMFRVRCYRCFRGKRFLLASSHGLLHRKEQVRMLSNRQSISMWSSGSRECGCTSLHVRPEKGNKILATSVSNSAWPQQVIGLDKKSRRHPALCPFRIVFGSSNNKLEWRTLRVLPDMVSSHSEKRHSGPSAHVCSDEG